MADAKDYCPENTEVLLRVGRALAMRGQREHALEIGRKVVGLAEALVCEDGKGLDLTNRAFDLLEVAEMVAELGETAESRHLLDTALRLAVQSESAGDIDTHKCIRAIALRLVKEGDIAGARDAATRIRLPVRRENTMLEVSQAFEKAGKNAV